MGHQRGGTDGDVVAEEAALLAKVAGGDRGEPLEESFHRYAGRLYALGLGLPGDSGLAEELVQESFVRLWRQAPRFDPARGSVLASAVAARAGRATAPGAEAHGGGGLSKPGPGGRPGERS